MSYFTKKIIKTYEFEGDTVVVEMDRLKKKDAIKLAPKLGEPDEEGNFKLSFADQMEFTKAADDMLTKYVTKFEGLKDADGNAMQLADVCGDESASYFMTLLSNIFGDLMSNSFAKVEDEKKSVKEPTSISESTKTDTTIPSSEE